MRRKLAVGIYTTFKKAEITLMSEYNPRVPCYHVNDISLDMKFFQVQYKIYSKLKKGFRMDSGWPQRFYVQWHALLPVLLLVCLL